MDKKITIFSIFALLIGCVMVYADNSSIMVDSKDFMNVEAPLIAPKIPSILSCWNGAVNYNCNADGKPLSGDVNIPYFVENTDTRKVINLDTNVYEYGMYIYPEEKKAW